MAEPTNPTGTGTNAPVTRRTLLAVGSSLAAAARDGRRKHAGHAAICGQCADACAKVIAALKALA